MRREHVERAWEAMTRGLGQAILGLGLGLGFGCGVPARPVVAQKIDWVAATVGPVAPLVAGELQRARREARRVLVYVGATWCEPCRRFHDAVRQGGLDARFGGLRLVEFDLDRDAARLLEAGYAPQSIPLLALPALDGRASGRQMEGSVKGEGAVAQMAPRLAALLGEAP